jgi:hypothetical protein
MSMSSIMKVMCLIVHIGKIAARGIFLSLFSFRRCQLVVSSVSLLITRRREENDIALSLSVAFVFHYYHLSLPRTIEA